MTDFPAPLSGAAQDETLALRPNFDAAGLVAAIVQDAATGEVLMLAWMNAEALRQTLATRRATYWSRSRASLWVKGETSGHVQDVVEIRVDCDQDAVLLKVRQTGAACHTEIPLVDFLERYSGDYEARRENPEKMRKIASEHFGYLMVDEPRAIDMGGELWSKRIKVCVVADAEKIRHYVDMSSIKGYSGTKYQEAGDCEFDNPFGQVPLVLAEGVYNPGEEVAWRREPILMPNINAEDKKAQIQTHWASQSFTPPWPAYEMPAEVAALPESERPQIKLQIDPDTGLPIPVAFPGPFIAMNNELDKLEDKLYGITDVEANQTSPLYLLNSGESRVQDPVTYAVMQREEFDSRLASAHRSMGALQGRVADMINYSLRNRLNSHRSKGEAKSDSDYNLSFKTTGNEKVLDKVVERGQEFEITPQDLDVEFTRQIKAIDTRVSTQMQNINLANLKRAGGAITQDDYLTMCGIENITKFKEDWNTEQYFNFLKPKHESLVDQQFAQFLSLRDGQPIEAVLSVITGIHSPVTPGMGGQQSGANGNGAKPGGTQVLPPPRDASESGMAESVMG